MKKTMFLFLIILILLLLGGCGVSYNEAIDNTNEQYGNGYFTNIKSQKIKKKKATVVQKTYTFLYMSFYVG